MNIDENDKIDLRDNMHLAKQKLDLCVKHLRNCINSQDSTLSTKNQGELELLLNHTKEFKNCLDSTYDMLIKYLYPSPSSNDEVEK